MKMDNLLSFSIVCGFFIGMLFAVIKFDNAQDIIIVTFSITFCLYIIIMLFSAMFVKSIEHSNMKLLNKKRYEKHLDYFDIELKKREDVSKKIREYLMTIKKLENDGSKDKSKIKSNV